MAATMLLTRHVINQGHSINLYESVPPEPPKKPSLWRRCVAAVQTFIGTYYGGKVK